jgi:hypothetical protein
MSMSFYAIAPHYEQPQGPLGPLDEYEAISLGWRALPATDEQKLAAGFKSSTDFSNANARMVLRSLDYDDNNPDYVWSFDAEELRSRVLLAQGLPPISDDGQPDIKTGNFIDCGVRPGYFHDTYVQIADVCEFAIAWGIEVTLA